MWQVVQAKRVNAKALTIRRCRKLFISAYRKHASLAAERTARRSDDAMAPATSSFTCPEKFLKSGNVTLGFGAIIGGGAEWRNEVREHV